jgi:hypothetical protein
MRDEFVGETLKAVMTSMQLRRGGSAVHAASSAPAFLSDHLWLLSKGAQEGAAHAVAIGKTRLLGDDVDRMALCSIIRRAVSTRRFSTALVGDWPGLGAERTAELTRT